MFSFVRLSAGGASRVAAARSEVSVLVEIARRVLGDSISGSLNWSDLHSHSAVRNLIAELIPGLEQIRDIDQTKREFHITGRNLANRSFPTPTGKAKFQTAPLPLPPDGQIRLMTVRSEGQFNSVVYDEEDIYRGQERRDVILLSQVDLDRLGLKPDQRVRVRSVTGEMRYLLARPFDVRPGNAIAYYPEANILVPRDVDPQSKTPGFKSVLVEIVPESK
ncbi:MAG: oxidoreductase subunit alpha, partial [Planctomycetota bacterium]